MNGLPRRCWTISGRRRQATQDMQLKPISLVEQHITELEYPNEEIEGLLHTIGHKTLYWCRSNWHTWADRGRIVFVKKVRAQLVELPKEPGDLWIREKIARAHQWSGRLVGCKGYDTGKLNIFDESFDPLKFDRSTDVDLTRLWALRRRRSNARGSGVHVANNVNSFQKNNFQEL